MMKSIKTIIQSVRKAEGLPYPASFYSSTDPDALHLLYVLYEVCETLRSARCWDVQRRKHSFWTIPGRTKYKLPADYMSLCMDTYWNSSDNTALSPSASNGEFTNKLYTSNTGSFEYAFRLFGSDENPYTDNGQFQIDPNPLSAEPWKAGTAYVVGDLVSYNGLLYWCVGAGTSSFDAPPTTTETTAIMDGTVTWGHVAADYGTWANATAYVFGDQIIQNGKLYKCSFHGISGSTPPSGTDQSGIVDGTVEWSYVGDCQLLYFEYLSRNCFSPPFWTPETAYSEDDYCSVNGNIYKCISAGTSSASTPPFGIATSGIMDGWIEWGYQDIIYEEILSDNDLCIFDYDLVKKGLKGYLRESEGGSWEKAEQEFLDDIDTAVSRMKPPKRVSFARGSGSGPRYRLPTRLANWR